MLGFPHDRGNRAMARTKRIHQMTISQWEAAFPTEDACADYLVKHRWPTGIHCPRCGSTEEVGEVSTMTYRWQCYSCAPDSGYRFSHIAGTVFENTNKPLRQWFRVIHTMLTSKKGVSALQIYRVMGFGSYKTAWYMCHRVRAALANEEFRRLMGIVEIDETFIGGKDKNRHVGKRQTGYGGKYKSVVIGAVERKGNVIARVIERVNAATVNHFLAETVSTKVSLLASDHGSYYNDLPFGFTQHGKVDHSKGQYVVGAIHT